MPWGDEATAGVLRALREARFWSEARLAREIHKAATAAGETVAGHPALVKMIRTWESGQHRPSPHYRYLLRAVFKDAGLSGGVLPAEDPVTVLTRALQVLRDPGLAALERDAEATGELDLQARAARTREQQKEIAGQAAQLRELLDRAKERTARIEERSARFRERSARLDRQLRELRDRTGNDR